MMRKLDFSLLIKNNGEERISITQIFHVNILLIKHVWSGLGFALMGPVSYHQVELLKLSHSYNIAQQSQLVSRKAFFIEF